MQAIKLLMAWTRNIQRFISYLFVYYTALKHLKLKNWTQGGSVSFRSVKLMFEQRVGPAHEMGSNHLSSILIGWTRIAAALSRDVVVRARERLEFVQ